MKSFLFLFTLSIFIATVEGFGVYSPVLSAPPQVRYLLFLQTVLSRHITHLKSTRTACKGNMEMRARICDLTGKKPNRQARVVTFSHKRIKKVQHVNLQWKRFFSEKLDRKVRLRVSTKAIKTVTKLGGIDQAAKKYDVDLSKF